MKNKNTKAFVIGILLILVGGWGVLKFHHANSSQEVIRIVTPQIGDIRNIVSNPGTVLPKNRLEIKPPVNGRIDQVLVQEGDMVKAGDTLALMSSTDRAALLDAARGQGEETLQYWQEVYKSIPLIAPIDGQVIVGTVQPGQTVTTADAVVVLSDHLIVRAQVDETDIGKIKPDQPAVISLDAYPDTKIDAVVEHIYYESKTVNNVTIYEVDLKPNRIPAFFRSGMNANVDFIVEEKRGVLLLPREAIRSHEGKSMVLVRGPGDTKAVSREVTVGISDDKNVEIVSGLSPNDEVILKSKKFVLPKGQAGSNPFFPSRRRNQNQNR